MLSLLFFLIVVIAIYASVNTKVQKQQKELNTIQKSYEQQEQINDIYEKKYDDYINSETSTIQVYADTNLKGEVKGQKKNTLGTVYTNVAQNKIKIFGGANSTYAYSETADGKRIVLSGNEMTIQATTSGKTIYTWVKGEDGEYTKYYTAVTVKLSTLQDKTIYVAEGKSTDIEINGENKGKITYSQIDTSYISIENNKVTGIKAGDTTITATESNGGAQAKITIKIVKLTLEKTKGITTVGDNKKIQVSGINNGTISAKSNDETIAKVTVSGTEVTIIPQKVGNIKITITESNAGASTEYEIQVVSITLAQNGGKYTMPTTGKATIKTKVKVENASKIEVAWTSSTLEWKTIENNSEIIKNDCEKGTYYLYVKVDDEYLYQSQAFIVGEEKIAIAIKTSTTEWTNKDITATITYPDVTTNSTRKAGYGTTLANAQTASNSATAPTTSVTVSENGYVFATATDGAGNVVTASKQITNIDKVNPTKPTYEAYYKDNNEKYTSGTWTNRTVNTKITTNDEQSGIKEIQYSFDGNTWKTLQLAESSGIQKENDLYYGIENWGLVNRNDRVYFRAIDNAGNISEMSELYNIRYDIEKPTKPTYEAYYKDNNEKYTSGTWTNRDVNTKVITSDNLSEIKEIQYSFDKNTWTKFDFAESSGIQKVNNSYYGIENWEKINARNDTVYFRAIDNAGNISEISEAFNIKYDISNPTVTLSSNGGSYAKPTSGNATIKTKITASDTGGSGLKTLEYAWSTSNTTEPTTYTTFTNGATVSKTDCTAGTYYLWTRVYDNAGNRATTGKVSAGFVVGAKTITITPNTTAWTNQNVTATIAYPDVTTSSTRKAGYGTTLANAQTASNSATAPTTSVTVSANGYVFATATDSAGNVVTASKQITNIDKALPTVTLSPNGGSYAKPTSGNATIKTKITASDTGGSGLKTLEYAWSTSNTTEPTTYTTFTNGATVSKTDCTAGTYYLWTRVYDNAGNRATTGKVSAGFVVGAKTITITPNTTAWTNQNVTATIAYPDVTTSSTRKAGYGTTLANAQTASNSATAPTTSVTVSANGYVFATATDSAGNVVTASRQITNIDKIAPIISEIKNSSNENWTNKTISLSWTITENGGSGISEVRFGRDGINWIDKLAQNEWYGFTRNYERNDAIYLQVIDKAGNKSNIVSTKMKTDLTEPQVTISPNGGSYAAPSAGSMATIKTTLTASDTGGSGLKTLEYAWSTSNTTEPTTYTTFTNGATVSKTDCTTGTYYLWTRVYDNAGNRATKGKVSSEFFVGTMAITITPSTTAWTNQNVIATVKYPDATVSNTRKAGFGTTLESAKTAANSSTAPATSVTASQNGYIYATATDVSGNVLTMTRQISNIDKTGPVISEITNSSNQNWTNQAIKLSWTITENGSGISKVRFGYDGVNWQDYLNETEWYGMTRNNERNDRIYIMAIDKTGNTSNIVSTALKIDKSAPTMVTPTISPSGWTNGNVTLTGKATDTASGISYYQWSTNSNLTASSSGWTSITNTKSQISQNYTATANGTYYFYAKDASGNVGKTSIKIGMIDKTMPSANIQLDSTTTTTIIPINATVTHTDSESGVKISSCKWVLNTTSTNIGTNPNSYTGGVFSSNSQKIALKLENIGTYYLHVLTIDNVGNSKETISDKITVTYSLASQVNIGDYVAYNTTNNYSYTSPKGTGISHGNGYKNQSFKTNSNLKWRVLKKNNNTGEIILISDSTINTSENKELYLAGGIGYLYAEEELNRICSIYGYGIGADKEKQFKYINGDFIEGTVSGVISGSGARCINVDDINEITGYRQTDIISNVHTIYYPSMNNLNGYSATAITRNDAHTYYYYKISNYLKDTTSTIYNMISKENMNYWLSSRALISQIDNDADFLVRAVDTGGVAYWQMGNGNEAGFDEDVGKSGIRPIVYLKKTLKANGKDSTGAWKILE